jgi:hypothetical protein
VTDELWGVGADARRVARPVLLCATTGFMAFAASFCAALLLGRGVVGSAMTALLVPLALSGALAVGLAVAFVAATVLAEPTGSVRVRRLLRYLAPVAAAVALFAYVGEVTEPAETTARAEVLAGPGIRTAPPVRPPRLPGAAPAGSGPGSRVATEPGRAPGRRAGAVALPAAGPVRNAPVTDAVAGPRAPLPPGTFTPEVVVGPAAEVSPARGRASVRRSASACRHGHRGRGRSRRAPRPRSCTAR